MAAQNKIIEMIATIKTIYPYYAKETDVENLVKTWSLLLKDFPDGVLDTAFYKCLQVCKQPPTPADVIEQVRNINKSQQMSSAELWNCYYKSLRETDRQVYAFRYTYVDASGVSQGDQARKKVTQIWNELPEAIKIYLSSESELIRKSQSLISGEDYEWEKKTFLRTLPVCEHRIEYNELTLNSSASKFMLE